MSLFRTVEMGSLNHTCEGELICKSTNEKIPYFNAPIFLENKEQIGKVDDIFGSINDVVNFLSKLE
jgi:H/ACA ribonucleoprotein complex subunit 1